MRNISIAALSMIAAEVLLTILVLLSILRWSESRIAFEDSVANERYASQLKDDVLRLRSMESVAQESQAADPLSNSKLIEIAVECGMRENQITGIQRLLPVQLGSTDYQQQDISVSLRAVTLQQIIQFGLNVESRENAKKITRISLRHASTSLGERSEIGSFETTDYMEEWNAELILTQVVFTATRASR